jgi:hypothetical protein
MITGIQAEISTRDPEYEGVLTITNVIHHILEIKEG